MYREQTTTERNAIARCRTTGTAACAALCKFMRDARFNSLWCLLDARAERRMLAAAHRVRNLNRAR